MIDQNLGADETNGPEMRERVNGGVSGDKQINNALVGRLLDKHLD